MAHCQFCGGLGSCGCGCLSAVRAFRSQMVAELEANRDKGGRRGPGGWIEGMTPEQRISELLYHVAKLAYAQRQFLQGDGDPEKVLEFAADVGNCSLMVVDGPGLLGVAA